MLPALRLLCGACKLIPLPHGGLLLGAARENGASFAKRATRVKVMLRAARVVILAGALARPRSPRLSRSDHACFKGGRSYICGPSAHMRTARMDTYVEIEMNVRIWTGTRQRHAEPDVAQAL
jgi:hypothetical protein